MSHPRSTRYDSATRQLEKATARTAAGARSAVGAVAVVAASFGAVPPVSLSWLAPLLAIHLVLTAGYARVWWRTELVPRRLVAADVAVTLALCLAQRFLVAEEALASGASWVSGLVTMTIVLAGIAWRPALAVPVGLAVAGAFAAGVRLASATQDVVVPTGVHLVQLLAIVMLMTLLRRSSAETDAFLECSVRAEIALMVERLRREDQLKQVGSIHETALHTLGMVGLGTYERPTPTLAAQVRTDLAALEKLRDTPGGDSVPIALDALLDEVAGRVKGLEVRTSLVPETVPGDVAERFARAVTEALSNVALHAGVREAEIVSTRRGGEIVVEVADRGRGFDQDRLPPDRFGVRGSILDMMRSLPNGGARISSGAQGTRVSLWWRP
ncbi:nitrate/nitrite sensor protein NarX [Nonomuraea coxensis DSM 45129]|uniref:histidine kinase n=1 Tax=Nonomuraea coxensis DSM 45129 TaxID=1122611 RepID=A0ABX8TWW0_9ACTN|nr:ATP-binding protein [Nonomuraea coxensis]QYC39985.1 nitrate/nitrite sensor protein NarX [Nonomuraea coxensis DSM 45129]